MLYIIKILYSKGVECDSSVYIKLIAPITLYQTFK